MSGPFDTFVIFAGMRTGSNFLESNLNRLPSVTCHGEAFNPHFIAYPNRRELLGIDHKARDAAPELLLSRIATAPGILNGFRYFHDHDPRILETLLADPRCAKIVLTRNPAESYVSWKIAQVTDQWKLTDLSRRKSARARFDAAEFDRHVATQQDFQSRVSRGLQRRGQTAFHITHDDLNDLDVLNGLAGWLGVPDRLSAVAKDLKRQNPEPLCDKVENYEEMQAALAEYDQFDLASTPNLEPTRGAAVPGYVAAPHAPLLYQPIPGGPHETVKRWLGSVEGKTADTLQTCFTQKTLRRWMREHPGHRRFTVLRHPVARAYGAYWSLSEAAPIGLDARLKQSLATHYDVTFADHAQNAQQEQLGFLSFLQFLKRVLNGQTSLSIDPRWGTQAAALKGFSDVAPPDLILREDGLAEGLEMLAREVGLARVPALTSDKPATSNRLADLYDEKIEAATRAAYRRDYLMFGFADWQPIVDQAALTRSASVRIV